MTFRQITHDNPGCASGLVGDDGAGVAAVGLPLEAASPQAARDR